ncbi:phosphatase PAP2 family protein [Micromonospora ureilytica]|uniref:Membrane-associated phospholipid phosphatase n=1 Tax=Micromonospora ureilytica TaxID=709868 RepID=A0ABS0JC87_9ACTN|nr:phosphatase PAP2 family protein [Micromonospora ureilytica]MBG6064669.1 membrane-associated phospholipid phosphatase [Micromonospora ureilytica]
MTIGTPRLAAVARDRGDGRRDPLLWPEECLFAVALTLVAGLAVATGAFSWALGGALAVVVAGLLAAFTLSRRRRTQSLGSAALDGPARSGGPARLARLVGGAARTGVPFLACVVIYTSLRTITPQLDFPLVDPALIEFDRAVFGGDVSRWVNDTLGSPALTLFMVICYLSYGVSQGAYALTTYLRGRVREYHDFALAISITAVVGYSGYVLVPGVGPHIYQTDTYADPLPGQEGSIGGALDAITAVQGPARDLFPSLHTAMTVVLMVYLWRDARRLFWWYLPVGLGLLLSTLYLRKHYAVDLLAGIALAALAVVVSGRVNRWWYRPRVDGPAEAARSFAPSASR